MGLVFRPLFLFIYFPFISTKIKTQSLPERMENKHAEPILLPTYNQQKPLHFFLLCSEARSNSEDSGLSPEK